MRLADGVQQYVLQRRATGLVYRKGEEKLLAFSRQVGDLQLAQVNTQHVLTYLNGPRTGTVTRHSKFQMLVRFFEFWSDRGAMPELLLPQAKSYVRRPFVPYVFTRAQLRSLLKATAQNDSNVRRMDRQTLRTLILLLYSTGALVGELLRLTVADVDMKASTITFRNSSGSRWRTIPLGPDVSEVLRKYISWRRRKGFLNLRFLVTKDDLPITGGMATVNWQRLRHFAGVSRTDGGNFQPRMLDLRCTFAVHRITSWIRNGADLNRMLPALAAYLGQVGLGSTDTYLSLTPERFRKELDKLSPTHGKKRWRDDKLLMDFLASL